MKTEVRVRYLFLVELVSLVGVFFLNCLIIPKLRVWEPETEFYYENLLFSNENQILDTFLLIEILVLSRLSFDPLLFFLPVLELVLKNNLFKVNEFGERNYLFYFVFLNELEVSYTFLMFFQYFLKGVLFYEVI